MKTLLCLSSSPNPDNLYWVKEYIVNNSSVVWVNNYNSFCNYIKMNGLPNAINFVDDLEKNKTGLDCASWLVLYCMDNNKSLPLWAINSSDKTFKDNINKLLYSYKKFYGSTSDK